MSLEMQLLTLWERGYSASPIERALLLSSVASPELTPDEILDVPIGYRDGQLIQLRRRLFGSQVASTANCTKCETKLELSFDLEPMSRLANSYSLKSFQVDWKETHLEVRCPTTRDILFSGVNQEDIEMNILRRCVVQSSDLEFEHQNKDDIRQTLSAAIEKHDPLGDIEFSMHCSECSHDFSTSFDIVSYLWSELNAWCQRLMNEIHLLARAYGWSEHQILRLSSWRRQVYLNMVRQ